MNPRQHIWAATHSHSHIGVRHFSVFLHWVHINTRGYYITLITIKQPWVLTYPSFNYALKYYLCSVHSQKSGNGAELNLWGHLSLVPAFCHCQGIIPSQYLNPKSRPISPWKLLLSPFCKGHFVLLSTTVLWVILCISLPLCHWVLSYPLTLIRIQQCTQSRLIKADTEADLLAHGLSGTEAPESAHKDLSPFFLKFVYLFSLCFHLYFPPFIYCQAFVEVAL